MNWLEKIFESFLWNSKFIVILAVIASLVSAIILFLLATYDVLGIAIHAWNYMLGHFTEPYGAFHDALVGRIVGAIDDYLLAVVLLIFSFGLYELFISEIGAAKSNISGSKILLIKTLDDLKDRLAKVILMILIVMFFKHVLCSSFEEPLNILCLAGGILLISLALYFGHIAHKAED
ncbi:YqhA family protein [bacterium]|nr:YqhA family protein [bacterium]MBU1153794.1 YqhA family protein [bacterium]